MKNLGYVMSQSLWIDRIVGDDTAAAAAAAVCLFSSHTFRYLTFFWIVE